MCIYKDIDFENKVCLNKVFNLFGGDTSASSVHQPLRAVFWEHLPRRSGVLKGRSNLANQVLTLTTACCFLLNTCQGGKSVCRPCSVEALRRRVGRFSTPTTACCFCRNTCRAETILGYSRIKQ